MRSDRLGELRCDRQRDPPAMLILLDPDPAGADVDDQVRVARGVAVLGRPAVVVARDRLLVEQAETDVVERERMLGHGLDPLSHLAGSTVPADGTGRLLRQLARHGGGG